MARKKAKTEAPATSDTEPAMSAASEPAGITTGEAPPEPVTERETGRGGHSTEAREQITVGLSDYQGGPKMHLQRSQQFKQMQIRFEGEQPGEQYLAMLADAGWRDRTESEGVWTKQIDREARWQSVQQMEREFRDIANAIRRDKGLAPALQGMAMA